MSKMKCIPITTAMLLSGVLLLSACGSSLENPEQTSGQNRIIKGTTLYVSPMGNDSNSGKSEQQPFKKVQHAVEQMSSGDTLIVLDGLYTGTLALKSGITIRAKNPRGVVFSGLEKLKAKFEKINKDDQTNGFYQASVEHEVKQLFFNDHPMTWAQWPNLEWQDNWIEDKKWAKASTGTGPGALTSKAFKEIAELDLTGAYAFIRYGKGNSNYSRKIESFDGETLKWNDDNFYSQKFTGEDGRRGSIEALKTLKKSHPWHPNKSKFFLAGDLDLLDAPGEWFVDNGTLYLMPLNGVNPNKAEILTKTSDYCINQQSELNDVVIQGIDFFGCSVKLNNTANNDITFSNAHFSYIGEELLFVDRVKGNAINKPIELAGTNITVEKSLFAGAKNTALKLVGSELIIDNSVFLENNRHANFESRSVVIEAKGSYRITRNTFFNNHSDAIYIRIKPKSPLTVKPEVAYNNIFNAGKYNSDVSGIYMPMGPQEYANVHHNWIHNINGNAYRLDLAGSQLNLHHNVFWSSKRGINVEGYGEFNIYNNTDVHNHVASALTRNVLNHGRQTQASLDKTFPPISDWNVLNNISDGIDDRVGPREKSLLRAQMKKGLVHKARNKQGNFPIVDRGFIQGNLTGEHRDIFINGNLSELNLLPKNASISNGIAQTEQFSNQEVTSLGSYRGAYDYKDAGWIPGSDWMPYGLDVIKTMAAAESFAKKYDSVSIVPEIRASGLPQGTLKK
ncbi:right-handed parallel beta-helix repeat-containing protein [Thalassotalea nanhaiensis]|uniref:Right-handed parallel beta-helix repeat-containing protein n=1 Tax=Thalassotalea nanhaiensis TaxID=3065648 RepID=A0ABY9TKA7_9GAMM|nr:right-handed parallel beta-helix repeat-containing protein [Colwelliaceae bacterium SQ345]